ncbi:WecB/TagA/CpsF family glycosyltransferase [Qipengyuania sp. DGS5-3]|uniref:WecB/TagA/CpsF family glycosyltransferase n=1 Tax=Qipengyuania sp. DGS5-3 TaxID=3349632 RepID=UPI0036D3C733
MEQGGERAVPEAGSSDVLGLTERRVDFLGAPFTRMTLSEAGAWVTGSCQSDTFRYLVTPNVDHIVILNEENGEAWHDFYLGAVVGSDLCVNDSRILGRLARLSGKELGLVPGSDLVRYLLTEQAQPPQSIALIGGKIREQEWLRSNLPESDIVHFDPPMGVRQNEAAQIEIAEFVETERADLVLMAFGAPQSEIVCRLIKQRGKARGVALCIGASVEFLSGAQTRAPRIMQVAGLEWLYRLLSDPARLWERYLVRGPRVFRLWWKSRNA